jgi:hypothetical protein
MNRGHNREDLPLPDGPYGTATRWPRTSPSSSSTIRSGRRTGAGRPARSEQVPGTEATYAPAPHAAPPQPPRPLPSTAAPTSRRHHGRPAHCPHGRHDGSRCPAATRDSIVAQNPALSAMAWYDGPSAARRSSRRSYAKRWTGPVSGSKGFSGCPTGRLSERRGTRPPPPCRGGCRRSVGTGLAPDAAVGDHAALPGPYTYHR